MKHKLLNCLSLTKAVLLMLTVAALGFSGCGDDEKPDTLPTVTTKAITNITTTTATAGGEITDDGNAEIIAAGIVYSSAVTEPTLVDDKVELTDPEDSFSASLEDLNSGTTYHVRAYATNSKGTAYGDVVDFITGNATPTVTNVIITGDTEVNKVLTATYTYNDAEGDPENGTTFQWYSATDATGTGVTPIAEATGLTYKIEEAFQGKYISVGVTPKSSAGSVEGIEVKSSFRGGVGEATTVTFMYNGQEVTYGIKTSATTGKKWLDRNLGASVMPTSFNDFANYGDLFQWGRDDDGHQLINRTGPNIENMTGVNGITSTSAPFETSNSDNPGHSKFIIVESDFPFDWRVPQNNNLWQGVNGINNPCPSGWRIPTLTELVNENLGTITEAFTKLNFTLTGGRSGTTGSFFAADNGRYWASTIDTSLGSSTSGRVFISGSGTVQGSNTTHATGLACRCIKE